MKHYKTEKHFQNRLRRYGKTDDYIRVGGMLFTMEEYDRDGRTITYANRKYGKRITVETNDRYKNGFGDAVITLDDATSYRTDIYYAQ